MFLRQAGRLRFRTWMAGIYGWREVEQVMSRLGKAEERQ